MEGQEIRRQLIRGLKSLGPPERGEQMGCTKGEKLGKNRIFRADWRKFMEHSVLVICP